MGSIGAFSTSGRARIESEQLSWDGISTVGAGPTGNLLNCQRGLRGTTAASHASAASVYNSWIHERIDEVSGIIDDELPNYDPFPAADDSSDPTPPTIESIARDLAVWEGFVKTGIDRSADNIHGQRRTMAIDKLTALRKGDQNLEPRTFTDTLTYGTPTGLRADEALLAKRGLDPWTCSINNEGAPLKFVPGNPDEMWGHRSPPRNSSTELQTTIAGWIYFSELRQRWIFRTAGAATNNVNITYKFTENRAAWAGMRRATERGFVDLARG